ncbi:uncharacterized protein LOC135105471 [Scylla paramamosain]|uniref:uncharacterized protein LOC135105471 n=1 Tax=Scylla paramamosain TaxID=85552 RepID=UPI003082C52C
MQLTLSKRRKKIMNGNILVAEILNLYPWIQTFDGIIKEFLKLEPQADEPDPRVAVLKGLEKYRLPIAILKKRKAVPLYMETLLELYDHDENACLVILGLLHLLGERKDSIFTKVPEEELTTGQSSVYLMVHL